jgi:hypothetical protein
MTTFNTSIKKMFLRQVRLGENGWWKPDCVFTVAGNNLLRFELGSWRSEGIYTMSLQRLA